MPELAAMIRQALPRTIGLGLPDPGDLPWPGETLTGAVPARLAEFRQGRSAARAAMRAAGLQPAVVPMRGDRSPEWPDGMTGSISHCQGGCLAIVGAFGHWAGMGIDLEPATALPSDLWPTILDQAEIAALPPQDPGLAALAIFVAKEAAYKAQFAASRQLIDFHDLVARRGGDDVIHLSFTRSVAPFAQGDDLAVRMFSADGLLAGLCLLPKARPTP